jgi:hypothetical protein
VVAAALAAAFAILLPASIASAWIRGTILSTSGYVAAVTPVAASPAVRAAVRDAVASQVDAVVSYAETSLPPTARGLAGLLGTGLASVARNEVSQLMASQAFQRSWADANRLAHDQLISVLNGDSALVTATGGQVVLNLLSLVNDVLHAVSGLLSAMTAWCVAGGFVITAIALLSGQAGGRPAAARTAPGGRTVPASLAGQRSPGG